MDDSVQRVHDLIARELPRRQSNRVLHGHPSPMLWLERDLPVAEILHDRQAHLDGFDLHANVRVPPNDRARLEHLCRYLLRPPLVQDRSAAPGGWPARGQAEGGLARWDEAPRVRAPRVPREVGGADATARDQPRPLMSPRL